jgi:hypothetical protein
MKSVDST